MFSLLAIIMWQNGVLRYWLLGFISQSQVRLTAGPLSSSRPSELRDAAE